MEKLKTKMPLLLFIKSKPLKIKLKYLLNDKYNLYNIQTINISQILDIIPRPILLIAELNKNENNLTDLIKYLKNDKFDNLPFLLIKTGNSKINYRNELLNNSLCNYELPIDDKNLLNKIKTISNMINYTRNITIDYICNYLAKLIKQNINLDVYNDRYHKYNITDKQKTIIQLIGEGYLNKEIADILNVKVSSVRIMISRLFKKCNVSNRMELFNLFRE